MPGCICVPSREAFKYPSPSLFWALSPSPPPFPLPSIMFPAGLSVFAREVLTTGLFWQICVLVILLLLLCEYAVRWWTAKRDDMPTSLNSLSISTIVPFVRNRYDFLTWGFQCTGETVFRFRLLTVRHISHALIMLLTRWFHRNQWWPFLVKAPDQRSLRPRVLIFTLASKICLAV